MTDPEFGETYFGTPVPRTKRRGLARNAAIALGNIGTEQDIPKLTEALRSHDEPLVRGHAAWALGRLGAQSELKQAELIESDQSVLEEISLAIIAPAR
jgi:epoxyqueuosine reductase